MYKQIYLLNTYINKKTEDYVPKEYGVFTYIGYEYMAYRCPMSPEVKYIPMTLIKPQTMHAIVFDSKHLEDSSHVYTFSERPLYDRGHERKFDPLGTFHQQCY